MLHRAAVKKAIKRRVPELRLDATVDLLIYLDCVLFLHRLAAEARLQALQDRCSVVKRSHIKAVAKVVLKMFQG